MRCSGWDAAEAVRQCRHGIGDRATRQGYGSYRGLCNSACGPDPLLVLDAKLGSAREYRIANSVVVEALVSAVANPCPLSLAPSPWYRASVNLTCCMVLSSQGQRVENERRAGHS